MWSALRLTLIGGVLFLIPLAFIVLALGKAFEITLKVARPLNALIPTNSVMGVAGADLLAIVMLIALCFIAGLIARHARIAALSRRLDQALTAMLPGYSIARSIVGGMVNAEEEVGALSPVLVRFDDYAQLAFEVERADDCVVVFLPGAPGAWSGASILVAPDRVSRVDMAPHEVVSQLGVLGRGGAARLRFPGREAPTDPTGGSTA